MDHSYSESDVSLSPTQILEKLEMLRHLQTMQRGKLLKQRLDYQNSTEISSSITEIVSHFSNSTTYNTFRSILQSSHDTSHEVSPRENFSALREDAPIRLNTDLPDKNDQYPTMDGVSALNLSQESEFIQNSPISSRSTTSMPPKTIGSQDNLNNNNNSINKKQISLDEMPILSPKKNFEELIVEKLKNEQPVSKPIQKIAPSQKKHFLKRGEGMARFGLRKNDLIIQNTKSLPWRRKSESIKPILKPKPEKILKKSIEAGKKVNVEIIVPEHNKSNPIPSKTVTKTTVQDSDAMNETHSTNLITKNKDDATTLSDLSNDNLKKSSLKNSKDKHPMLSQRGKTWQAVLTKEQDDFLRQLKQSDYYKNFASPSKSIDSEVSCCESISNAQNSKEIAEQNLFDLIENKVSHDSFSIENSFFNRFLRKNKLEYSGESTPLIMQKCLSENPNLMRIAPDLVKKNRNAISYSEDETCHSECTDCSETCCSEYTCCSCKSTPQINDKKKNNNQGVLIPNQKLRNQNENKNSKNDCQDDTITAKDTDIINANMAEMNAKLVATSELLKDRLRELEDEIETFRKENATINKMREEIDAERQKFYEEKAAFEQKFNEEKVLSEYYLAEEKEKLSKQKQMYERYVRDMRGRLNKKEKDEVTNLKTEISNLKEEIRVKDAKSTSIIARLRNQLKIMEKDKKALEDEVEKLKKENKRIQHSNEITRRLTNLKYLEQINKKLSNMTSRDTRSDVESDPNVKYKTFEIERQKEQKKPKGIRTRAKSVPNLNVTSKYAKYFSQKDSISDKEKGSLVETHTYSSDEDDRNNESLENLDKSYNECENNFETEDNYLEKMYNDRFKTISPPSKRSSGSNAIDTPDNGSINEDTNDFFIQKSNSVSSSKQSLSPHDTVSTSKNTSILSQRSNSKSLSVINDKKSYFSNPQNVTNSRNKSPISILSNHSSSSQRPATVIYKDTPYIDDRMIPSPEPTISKTSLTKTSLNPLETKLSDGSRELRFPNGNVKIISADGKYSKFIYYNGDVKENFYNEGRVKYYYAESKTYHTTHPDGLEVLEFPDGQVEKRYSDGSSEIRLPNGSIRYFDPKNDLVQEDWRFPDGTALTVSANGEKRIVFPNGQIEVHAKDHKRREFPDGTVKLVYNDGTSETRYASGRIRVKDKHGNLIMDSTSRVHMQNH
ncbi:centromere protein J [Colias croceus]|uniref:centromere protein J n=1 Tax=Colias crocea TaxID=72248 RepID=UPI001E27B85B|nr:centromere protein J [Colias croceus]